MPVSFKQRTQFGFKSVQWLKRFEVLSFARLRDFQKTFALILPLINLFNNLKKKILIKQNFIS